tara:strand:+ start:198 stop:515 length:318 start_codon:yes stop_codon:yes gene_type:complete
MCVPLLSYNISTALSAMKYDVGDLVLYRDRPFVIKTGEWSSAYLTGHSRGNGLGIVIEINHPMFDTRLHYTYRVQYQNGGVHWEAEDSLLSLEKFIEITGSYKKD